MNSFPDLDLYDKSLSTNNMTAASDCPYTEFLNGAYIHHHYILYIDIHICKKYFHINIYR